MKKVALHIERIVVEPQPGVPVATGSVTAALQHAVARELAGCSDARIAEAVERAVRAAFTPRTDRRA